MPCPAVTTGPEFLVRTLAHLDCQAQTVGSFGFQSLAQPGSTGALAVTGLLTLFVAIYGIRLLLGRADDVREVIDVALKVGIVLTLAVSWPAWRVVAYDTVLYGPAEVAGTIFPSTLPAPQAELPQRLQGLDTAIADVTFKGTGRMVSETPDAASARQFQSIALADETGFGWARAIFLASTIGSLGLLRIAAVLLLALAPLLAGLLLFDATRGVFAGWLRGLGFVAVGSLGMTLLLSLQVALMEPWLADVLTRRNGNLITPMAPTEMLALVLGFAIAAAGMLMLLARVTFQNAWPLHRPFVARIEQSIGRAAGVPQVSVRPAGGGGEIPVHSRALAISESVTSLVRREEAVAGGIEPGRRIETITRGGIAAPSGTAAVRAAEPLGSGYRRTSPRETASRHTRDDRL